MKRLRRAGHEVRYLVAGEYGKLKDRAHFHAILFFTHIEPLPDGVPAPGYNAGHLLDPDSSSPFSRGIPSMQMSHIREWPHGHVQADWSASESAVRYVCKYILADDKKNAWFSLSKKPALGHAWFQQKAAFARDLEVLPSRFEYLPPGASKDRPYLMTGATRRDYLNAITIDPALRSRMSEWVGKTFDKFHRQRLMAELESQPLELLQAAFDDRRARQDENQSLRKLLRRLDETARLADMLETSETGRLRRFQSQWVREEDLPNEQASS
ncbi:rolling circle replication-associated protein [Paracoccus aminovorans]